MSSRPDEGASPEIESRGGLLGWLNTIAKLLAAGAVVAAAIIAGYYQSNMTNLSTRRQSETTALSLLSQREQVETQLRATMFSNLIGPIAGPHKDGTEITPEREKLLVELLALNFHENFELKPLLEHVDERLSSSRSVEAEEKRKSLRSVARRISARQIGSLLREGRGKDITKIHQLTFIELPKDSARSKQKGERERQRQLLSHLSSTGNGTSLGFPLSKKSPDKVWNLGITVTEINEKEQNVTVVIHAAEKEHGDEAKNVFTLTWFDFPLTDNTLFADGNRFAVVLERINIDASSKMKTAIITLIWFPKNYFTPRERPINYSEFREKLGLIKLK